MHTVHYQNTDIPLYAKFNIKKGKITAAYSIALFDKAGEDMLLYHKATDILPETESRVTLPQPVAAINECYVRCITDFKSLEPSGIDKFVINMEIYQGDRLLGTVEQQGELAYNQKCVMLFSKLVGQ